MLSVVRHKIQWISSCNYLSEFRLICPICIWCLSRYKHINRSWFTVSALVNWHEKRQVPNTSPGCVFRFSMIHETLLLARVNLNPVTMCTVKCSMKLLIHSIDKLLYPTFYKGCNSLSVLGLKLNHVSKRGHGWHANELEQKITSMGKCKKDVTPLLTHWSYVFLAINHRIRYSSKSLLFIKCPKSQCPCMLYMWRHLC